MMRIAVGVMFIGSYQVVTTTQERCVRNMKSYDLDTLLVGRWYRPNSARSWAALTAAGEIKQGRIKEAVKTDLYAGENYRVYKIRFGDLNNWATIAVEIGE